MSIGTPLVLAPFGFSNSPVIWAAGTAASLAAWVAAYLLLAPMAEWLNSLLPVEPHSHLGEAVAFFAYDVPKVLLLLTLVVFGLAIAIASGWVIGRLHLEGWLEEWVRNVRAGTVDLLPTQTSLIDRIKARLDAVRDIVGRVWIWVIAGIAVGAFIHGYVPAELLGSIMNKDTWWSVPAAVLLGIPMYSNAAGMIPVVEALLGKGAVLGTVLAFMMAVTAPSFPEMVILRKVMTVRLIAVFTAVVGCGILAVGFLFNALF